MKDCENCCPYGLPANLRLEVFESYTIKEIIGHNENLRLTLYAHAMAHELLLVGVVSSLLHVHWGAKLVHLRTKWALPNKGILFWYIKETLKSLKLLHETRTTVLILDCLKVPEYYLVESCDQTDSAGTAAAAGQEI